MTNRPTHIIRASLDKTIYRDVEIGSDKSLYQLAKAINEAFGFNFDHAFGFYNKLKGNYFDSPLKYELFADMGESDARSVKRTRIAEAFPRVKTKMLFLFDYGDEWHFKVECVGQGNQQLKGKYPRVIKSVGAAPEQYPGPDEEPDEQPQAVRGFAIERTAEGDVKLRPIELGKRKR